MNQLFLLHGALGAKSQFKDLCQVLEDTFEVHTLNFTGHGGDMIPDEEFSIELFAGDIIRYMYDNSIERTDVFGYSMGGYASLYASRHFPEKFNRIFTLATKFEWTPEIAARETRMLDVAAVKTKVPAFASELSQRHGAGNWERVLAKTAEMMTGLGCNSVLKDNDFSEIESEILVSVGDRDKMVTIEETAAVFRRLKKGEMLVLPGTPHPLEMVDAAILAGEIKRFLVK